MRIHVRFTNSLCVIQGMPLNSSDFVGKEVRRVTKHSCEGTAIVTEAPCH